MLIDYAFSNLRLFAAIHQYRGSTTNQARETLCHLTTETSKGSWILITYEEEISSSPENIIWKLHKLRIWVYFQQSPPEQCQSCITGLVFGHLCYLQSSWFMCLSNYGFYTAQPKFDHNPQGHVKTVRFPCFCFVEPILICPHRVNRSCALELSLSR